MKKIEEVTLLYEVSETLNAHLDLKKSLYRVLDLLSNSMNMVRGAITILDPIKNEIHIEVAHGISLSERTKGRYKLGEGITGRVIETGRPMAVPKIDDEPLFLTSSAVGDMVPTPTIPPSGTNHARLPEGTSVALNAAARVPCGAEMPNVFQSL